MDSGLGNSKGSNNSQGGGGNSMPSSPSLLVRRKPGRVHKITQTDVLLPQEDLDIVRDALGNCEVLRELLNLKSFSMLEENTDTQNSFSLRIMQWQPKLFERIRKLVRYVEQQAVSDADYYFENWIGSLMELVIDTIIRVSRFGDGPILKGISQLVKRLLTLLENESDLTPVTQNSVMSLLLKLSVVPHVADDLIEEILKKLLDGFQRDLTLPEWLLFAEFSCLAFQLLAELLEQQKVAESSIVTTRFETVQDCWKNLCPLIRDPQPVVLPWERRLEQMQSLAQMATERLPALAGFFYQACHFCQRYLT